MGTINVRAGHGLRVVFPLKTKAAPGRRHLKIDGDTIVEVNGADPFILRRLRVGDLVVVKTEQPKPARKPKSKPKTKTRATTDTE